MPCVIVFQVIPVDTSKQSWKLYRRRFCVHFKMALDRSGYTPTILCYDNQDNKLEVNKQNIIIIELMTKK